MKISVIVPVYKTEKYLRQCLDSLLAQDYPDYEIILVDDGSPDNCGRICNEYAANDVRVRVIHQENSGASAARNTGMRVAKGDYISFIDSDDLIDSNYLTTLSKYMTPGGMAACDIKVEKKRMCIVADDRPYDIFVMNKADAQFSVLSPDGGDNIYCGSCCKLFDRNIVREHKVRFREDVAHYEDELFVIQYLSHLTANVVWSRIPRYHYRIHSESTARQLMNQHKQFDFKYFSAVTAREWELSYIEQTPEMLRLLSARQIEAKRNALLLIAINDWYDLKYYKQYLQDVRTGLLSYLLCDVGASTKGKILTLLCSIHPRIGQYVYELWRILSGKGSVKCSQDGTKSEENT